jgi:colanic acid/amylovoran biosynthesis glycosyltransferase
VSLPRTAYILLWFPKPSETFVFREVINLRKMGLPLKVFTLYGELADGMSQEMREASRDVERLGLPYLKTFGSDIRYWWRSNRRLTAALFRTVPFRRWNGVEKGGENVWAFFCGFHLARRFREEGIEHIHAPWASGPATAAWIASRLTGIPFTFTSRAWDIYPADGALKEKIHAAAFVRSETGTNIGYLAQFCDGDTSKFRLTYNGVPLNSHREAPVKMERPFQLLALGRFVGKKGYDFLLQACRILADRGVEFRLTMAGDGPLRAQLGKLAQKLGIADRVHFPGFVQYDAVSELISSSDMLIMPSVVHSSGDRDGIPTVIMECLMHRVPVIATDVSGIAEVIEDGVTGFLIPEKNADAIADAVVKMVGDREAALAMAETGRSKVLELFDPERNHRKVLELYQTLPVPPR